MAVYSTGNALLKEECTRNKIESKRRRKRRGRGRRSRRRRKKRCIKKRAHTKFNACIIRIKTYI